MFNNEVTKKFNDLAKEQFMLVYDELKKMIDEKYANLNDVQAELASYHVKLDTLLKEGKYDEMGELSKETQKISNELPSLTKEYEEIKNIFDLIEKYYHNISNYNFTELLNVQKVISDIVSKFGLENEKKKVKELKSEIDYYWELAQLTHDERYYQYAKDAYDDLVPVSRNHKVELAAEPIKGKKDDEVPKEIPTEEELVNLDEQKATEVRDNLEKALKTGEKKYLTAAAELMSELSSNKELSEALKKEYKETEFKVERKENIDEVNRLLAEVERNSNEKSLEKALSIIESFEDCDEKKRLLERVNSLKARMPEMEFKSILSELEEKNEANEEINGDKLSALIEKFNRLPDSTQDIYKSRMNDIIGSYNQTQQYKSQKMASEEYSKKDVIKKKITEFFGAAINAVCGSKLYRKYVSKKIKKYKEEQNDEKLEKYQNIRKEFGIAGGIRLFLRKDKLERMKLKLYKKQPKDITTKDELNYTKSANRFAGILDKKLNKYAVVDIENLKDAEELYGDAANDIVKNIIRQKIEACSTIAFNYPVMRNTEGKKEEVTEVNDKLDELKKYVLKAYKTGIINSNECWGYISEICDIQSYYQVNDIPYHYVDKDVDKAIEYYSDDVHSDKIMHAKIR